MRVELKAICKCFPDEFVFDNYHDGLLWTRFTCECGKDYTARLDVAPILEFCNHDFDKTIFKKTLELEPSEFEWTLFHDGGYTLLESVCFGCNKDCNIKISGKNFMIAHTNENPFELEEYLKPFFYDEFTSSIKKALEDLADDL